VRKMWRAMITLFLSLSMMIGCYHGAQGTSKNFTPDNCLIMDGRPFFPIGIYSVYPVSAIEEIKEAGFNTVHTYEYEVEYLKEFVRSTENAGLKALIYPGSRLEKSEFNMNNVKKAVRHLAKSPAILSWYLSEEPDLFNISPEEIEKERKAIRHLDPVRPASILVAGFKKYANYSDSADIFMIEIYPVPRRPITEVAEHVDVARKAIGGNAPVWAVLQAFGYYNDKNRGWGWEREPTFQEMKAMTYLAISRGARGIFYFTYYGSQYFIKDSPRHWEELKAIAGELRDVYPLLVAPDVGNGIISAAFAGINQSSLFWTVRQVTEGNSLIQAGTYLIVVNGVNSSGTATFELKRHDTSSARVVLENRGLTVSNGIFSDNFAPYEVHIYRLE
jgi:hypothetical protein